MDGIDFKNIKLGFQPQVVAGLMRLTDSSEASFKELDRLVRADPNMTAFIIKAANSPLYYRGNQIKALPIAISLLGFNVVRALAIAANSQSLFQTGDYARFKKTVWEHSVVT